MNSALILSGVFLGGLVVGFIMGRLISGKTGWELAASQPSANLEGGKCSRCGKVVEPASATPDNFCQWCGATFLTPEEIVRWAIREMRAAKN